MHKKLSCLNGRAKRKQDVRVADEYFLIKLVTWSRKQDLRVVDKYFLIKPVTWTRNEIVNTYQSRLGKNQINFFCLYNQNTDSVTRDGGGGGGGGGGGAIRQRLKPLDVWLVWCHLSRLSEEFARNLRYCALGSKPPPFTRELAQGRGWNNHLLFKPA